MTYKVHEVAKMAGISVRTLHYYDEIGLLSPAGSMPNGYRYYGQDELLRLQQILFFRELAFPLEQIKEIMNAPQYDMQETLREQKKALFLKKERIEKLIDTIEKTIEKKGGETMNTDDLFDSFDNQQMEEYQKEAKARWGHTDAWKQSQQRTKHWTKADYKKVQDAGNKLTQALADAMDKGIESEEVQTLIKEHHKGIEVFYECSYEMYRNLGQMYVDDPRFTAFYDKFKPGLAVFLRDAIVYYCDKQEK